MDDVFLKEVMQYMKAVHDLSVRLEERVKIMTERQSSYDAKIEKIVSNLNELVTTVGIMDSKSDTPLKEDIERVDSYVEDVVKDVRSIDLRLRAVESTASEGENRWKSAFNFVADTAKIIFICYLLYKLNLQGPPLP